MLGVEKILWNRLLKPGSNKQLHTLGPHAGMAFSGWAPDARQLIERGRAESENYEETYGSAIPPAVLADRMAQFVHYFTLHGALRPFGTGAIVAGYDPELREHSLYMIEPSGVQYRYFGTALGKVPMPLWCGVRTPCAVPAPSCCEPRGSCSVRLRLACATLSEACSCMTCGFPAWNE